MAKKKYLDTKEGSLEQSILGVWEEAAKKMSEKLSAKQKKLDVDGDGEIEGSDLAKLRAKKGKKEGAMKRGKDLDTFKPKPKKEGAAEDYKSWLEAVLEVRGLKKKVDEEEDDQPKKSKTETGKQPDKVEINPDVEEKYHNKKKK
jgi:hypothetical protein